VSIGFDFAAQLDTAPRQVLADSLFLAGRAVNGDQGEEGFNQTGFANQGDTSAID
jgi:hypothetical protein